MNFEKRPSTRGPLQMGHC